MDVSISELILRLDPLLSNGEVRRPLSDSSKYRLILDPYREKIISLRMGPRQCTFEKIALYLKRNYALDISEKVVSLYFQSCLAL